MTPLLFFEYVFMSIYGLVALGAIFLGIFMARDRPYRIPGIILSILAGLMVACTIWFFTSGGK